MSYTCKKCTSTSNRAVSNSSSWISALLIVIIPKCPLCIMAYSSAITMCGGPELYSHGGHWLSYIPLALSLFIMIMLLLNYKDRRTTYALIIALFGSILVLLNQQQLLGTYFYYLGTVLLTLSIWLNGSLFSFLRKIKTVIHFSHY